MTTYQGFIGTLSGIVFPGVNTRLTEPPDSLEHILLPASWVQFPTVEENAWTIEGEGGRPLFHAQLVVAYIAVAQSTKKANWMQGIALVDVIRTALHTTRGITRSKINWKISGPLIINPGNVDYWALFTDINGQG